MRKYHFQTMEYWKQWVEGKVLGKLRTNAPGAEYSGPIRDRIMITLSNILLMPLAAVRKKKSEILHAYKDICFWAHGTIFSCDTCGLEGVGFKSLSIQIEMFLAPHTLCFQDGESKHRHE